MSEHAFRGRMRVGRPEDWFAKESLTLLAPDGRANVIASSEPLDETISTEAYAEVQGDVLRLEFPGYRELAYESMQVFGGRRGLLRRFEWSPPDGEAITQLQIYCAEGGRGYTATATTPTADYLRFEQQLVEVLESLELGD